MSRYGYDDGRGGRGAAVGAWLVLLALAGAVSFPLVLILVLAVLAQVGS